MDITDYDDEEKVLFTVNQRELSIIRAGTIACFGEHTYMDIAREDFDNEDAENNVPRVMPGNDDYQGSFWCWVDDVYNNTPDDPDAVPIPLSFWAANNFYAAAATVRSELTNDPSTYDFSVEEAAALEDRVHNFISLHEADEGRYWGWSE